MIPLHNFLMHSYEELQELVEQVICSVMLSWFLEVKMSKALGNMHSSHKNRWHHVISNLRPVFFLSGHLWPILPLELILPNSGHIE